MDNGLNALQRNGDYSIYYTHKQSIGSSLYGLMVYSREIEGKGGHLGSVGKH